MRSSRLSALELCGAAAVLALLCSGPLAAYTIWLKDGSSIVAREKYVLQGDKAIITLVSGTQTFLDAAKIDAAKTEASNRGKDYGTTDLGNTRVLPGAEAPPPQNKSLTDLIATHRPSNRELPTARRAGEVVPGQLRHSESGYLDLTSLPHAPFAHPEVTVDLLQFLRSLGIDNVELFAGSQSDRLLAEFTTASEGSVFQSLTASANALIRARERFPQQVAALELLMKTPSHEKAGQFVLTPEAAIDLVAKKIEVPAYFVANVQF